MPRPPVSGWRRSYFARWFLLGSLVGLISGAAALALHYLTVAVRSLALGSLGFRVSPPSIPGPPGGLAFLGIAAAAGLASGLLTEAAPEARGSGIDSAIAAYHELGGAIRRAVAPIKLLASSIVMGAGLSAGDEGPIAQASAGFASWASDLMGLDPGERRALVGVAIGTGIGTIFKTPIGGAFLAAEILYRRDFEYELVFPAFVASAVGYTIYGAVTGYGPIFGFYTAPFDPARLPLYALLGVLCGLVAIAYVRAYNAAEDAFSAARVPRWARPALGGLAAGAIALAFPEVMGTGTSWTAELLSPSAPALYAGAGLLILAALPFAKIAATSLTVGSGGSGGVFAPGIFVGAATGLLFGVLMHMLAPSLVQSPVPFAIVGMLAVFGAAGKLPISVTVMVVEMTGSLQLLPAELIAVTIAYVVSGPATIYRSQRASRAGAARPSPSAGRGLTSLGARSMREVGLYREPHVGGLDGLPPGVSGELDRPLRDVQPYLLQGPAEVLYGVLAHALGPGLLEYAIYCGRTEVRFGHHATPESAESGSYKALLAISPDFCEIRPSRLHNREMCRASARRRRPRPLKPIDEPKSEGEPPLNADPGARSTWSSARSAAFPGPRADPERGARPGPGLPRMRPIHREAPPQAPLPQEDRSVRTRAGPRVRGPGPERLLRGARRRRGSQAMSQRGAAPSPPGRFLIVLPGAETMARLSMIAEELLRRYPDRFTTDFEHNKRALEELVEAESKYVRNVLAGYITRYMRRISAAAEAASPSEPGEEAGGSEAGAAST